MKETLGLYSTDGSFRSDQQIRRKLALDGDLPITDPKPLEKRDWNYWKNRFRVRQEQYLETSPIAENHIEVTFKDRICLNEIGDLHAGSPWADYDRFEQEIEVITNTPESYVILLGDLVDGYFWGGAAQNELMEQNPEQFKYMKSFLEYMAGSGRLLCVWAGDHDHWARRMGLDPYVEFQEDFNLHYMHGIGYITFNVGTARYKLAATHKHKGHSIYTKSHAAQRLYRDAAEDADICTVAHSHRKGHTDQTIKKFGGEPNLVHYNVLGAYKTMDDYGRKQGYPRLASKEMFGAAYILEADSKHARYYDDILRANKEFQP